MCLIFVYYYILNLCLISIIIKPSNKEPETPEEEKENEHEKAETERNGMQN